MAKDAKPGTETADAAPAKSSKKLLIIILLVVVVLGLAPQHASTLGGGHGAARQGLGDGAQMSESPVAMQTLLVSRKASMPSWPPSRPMPEVL